MKVVDINSIRLLSEYPTGADFWTLKITPIIRFLILLTDISIPAGVLLIKSDF